MKYDIVEIKWLDAQAGFGQAESVQELIDYHEPMITHSVGYLLYECEEYIILGFMMFGEEMVKDNQLIPKGMIKEKTTIKQGDDKK